MNFTWLNAARGHAGAAEFYNRGEWDIFQSRIDLHLPVGAGTAEIDTDVENRARDYVGFWDAHGSYRMPEARTRAIYEQRRFACNGHASLREAPANQAKSIGSLRLGSVVRIGEEQGGFVQVDRDEDGIYDGWTALSDLSPSFSERPRYLAGTGKSGSACFSPTSPATTASMP